MPAGAGAPDSGLAAAPPGVETTETNEHSLAPAHVTEIRSRAPTYTIDLAEDEGRVDVDSNDRASRGFVDGAFHLATLAPDTTVYAGTDVSAADFYLEVDVNVAEADTSTEYGVMFRCEGAGDCYAYQIDSLGNYRLYEYSAGIPLSLLDLTLPNSDAIDGEEGAVNRLGLLVQGSEFTLLVNDTVLAEARDDTYRERRDRLCRRVADLGGRGRRGRVPQPARPGSWTPRWRRRLRRRSMRRQSCPPLTASATATRPTLST